MISEHFKRKTCPVDHKDMARRFEKDKEVIALASVHAPFSDEASSIAKHLPIIKGEVLTIIRSVGIGQWLVLNKHGIKGCVCESHIAPADLYINEEFYLCDFTSVMAETVLRDKPDGTFIVRASSKDQDTLVISAKFERINHYSFKKKEGGVDYDGTFYQSIPVFVNKCSMKKILAGELRQWIKQSDINVPQIGSSGTVSKTTMSLRIVGKVLI